MGLKQNLAFNLRTLRALKNASLEEFADEAGISRTTLFGIEHQTSNSTIETIEQIGENLDVSPLTILSDKYDPLDEHIVKTVLDQAKCLSYMSERDITSVARLFEQLVKLMRDPLRLYFKNHHE